MCGTRLAANAGPKKVAKNRHLGTIVQLCQAISSRLGSVTAQQSSSGRQPNFGALNRGRHLCSTGRPSRWALAQSLVIADHE